MLILGITDNSVGTASISINVSQREVVGFLVYYYVLIGLGILVGLFLIIGGSIFIIRRRRLREEVINSVVLRAAVPEVNDISYFNSAMPSFRAEQLGPERLTCPICLMQIERNEVVRRTPCGHVFHSACIDSWCLKNLNCPVCRCELSLEGINQRISEDVAVPLQGALEMEVL